MEDKTFDKLEKLLKKWKTSRLKYYRDKSVSAEEEYAAEQAREIELRQILVDELDANLDPVDDYLLTVINLIRHIDRRNRSIIQRGLSIQDELTDTNTIKEMISSLCEYLDIRLFETVNEKIQIKYQVIKKGEEFKLSEDYSINREKDLIFDEDE